ncbi:MAG TPA: NAD(P)-dependent oxidoreductase [Planctomycetota bacterium]|nr:NAD(P)-dependent oxidoreductase [Planctomycetota bacterium]
MDLGTVAVFGAGGKIGRHVLRVLERRGLRCRALVHTTPLEARGVATVRGSVTDPKAVAKVARGADAIVQLATTKEDPATFFDVSIRGTLNILEACRNEPVKQLILFGGDAAMGIWFYPQPIPIDENHPRMAYPGCYAFSKVIEEVMAEQYGIQYGLPFSVLRSSWVFDGDDLLNHFSILKNVDPAEKGHGFGDVSEEVIALVRAGQERIPILVNGEGVPFRRHIVHIDDVMQAFDKMLGNPAALGQSFNIAGPAPFDYRVAAKYLSKKSGIPTVEMCCPRYHSFEINISRARCVLGYAPENDFFRMADRALEARRRKEQ